MLTAAPRDSKTPVKPPSVNCAPWSVLKISGWPSAKAASSAHRQKPAFSPDESSRDSTYRLCQSITATRRMNPRSIRMYLVSALHTWFGRAAQTPLNRYGQRLRAVPGALRRFFG